MICPPRPKVKGMLKIGALLVLVAFILFIRPNVRSVPIRVHVTFAGFTNRNWYYTTNGDYTTTDGTFPVTLAYFCVSNAGKCAVVDGPFHKYEMEVIDGSNGYFFGG